MIVPHIYSKIKDFIKTSLLEITKELFYNDIYDKYFL